MSDLIPFQFGAQSVRIEVDADGEPWWVLSDCCAALGLTEPSRTASRIDPEDRKKSKVLAADGKYYETLLINESGLYTLLLRSSKPEAKQFKRWITSEVLPSIRKTGVYAVSSRLPHVRDKTLQMIIDMAVQLDAARILAEEAKLEAEQATANAHRALQTQLFFTVAEYVYINELRSKLPETAYRACSDHLKRYCLEHNIPFRRTPIGGKKWADENAYHVNVYTEALPGWLKRRFAQGTLRSLPPPAKD